MRQLPYARSGELEARQPFADVMHARGVRQQDPPVFGGTLRDMPVKGNKGREGSDPCRVDSDARIPAEAIDNRKRGGFVGTWQAEDTTMALSPAEQAALDAQAKAEAARRKREREVREDAGAQAAMQLLAGTRPADALHPYLTAKKVGPHGLRMGVPGQAMTVEGAEGTTRQVGIAGRLLVPLRDISGRIRNVQVIAAQGGKLYLAGAQKAGTLHMLGALRPGAPVIVAGSYATAATIYRATGMAVAAALDTGNLMAVAVALRSQAPTRPIYLAADNDHHLPLRTTPLPNAGREMAMAAAAEVGGKVLLPEPVAARATAGKGTDWNDHEACHGLASTWPAMQAAGLETGEA